MKVNILGAEYEYGREARVDDPGLDEADGYCNCYSKKIVVVTDDGYRRESSDTDESMQALMAKVARHEVVHAFFAESGLREYCDNEQLVDWIAWHFPDMLKAMQQIDALPEPVKEVTTQYIGSEPITTKAGD